MLKHHLLLALRHLTKEKLYTFTNTLSLAIGIAVCLVMYLTVGIALSDFSHHEKHDHTYTVSLTRAYEDGRRVDESGGPRWAEVLQSEAFGGVEYAVPVYSVKRQAFEVDGRPFEENVLFAGDDFFALFSFPLLRGTPRTVLSSPNNVVVSERVADRLFGDQNPVGQSITLTYRQRYHTLYVTGVAENAPLSSALQPDVVVPFALHKQATYGDGPMPWQSPGQVYVSIPETSRRAPLAAQAAPYVQAASRAWETEDAGTLRQLSFEPLRTTSLNHPIIYLVGAFCLAMLCLTAINYATTSMAGRSGSPDSPSSRC